MVKLTRRGVLLSLVNDCEECAMMGERIMCQATPKEEMRLECIDHALTQLKSLELTKRELTAIVLKAWRDFETAIIPPSLQRYVAQAILKAQQLKWEGK